MLEELVFCLSGLGFSFILLYILLCLMYLFHFHNTSEKDMWKFYKQQWRKRKEE